MIKRTIYSTIISLFSLCGINAQNVFEVAIVSDAAKNESHFFEEAIKSEITALLASQHQLNFTEIYTSGDI
jgi:hypothetical protein